MLVCLLAINCLKQFFVDSSAIVCITKSCEWEKEKVCVLVEYSSKINNFLIEYISG